jgi:hypothetical protein
MLCGESRPTATTVGNCVEADVAVSGCVLVRDTANRDGVMRRVPDAAWRKFTASLRCAAGRCPIVVECHKIWELPNLSGVLRAMLL